MITLFRLLLFLSFILVSYLAIQPSVNSSGILYLDKVFHFFSFFILSWLSDFSTKKNYYLLITFLLIFYGLGIEVAQSYIPSRSSEILDFVADLLGILVYFYLALKFKE